VVDVASDMEAAIECRHDGSRWVNAPPPTCHLLKAFNKWHEKLAVDETALRVTHARIDALPCIDPGLWLVGSTYCS
jgi:hypothetical protein